MQQQFLPNHLRKTVFNGAGIQHRLLCIVYVFLMPPPLFIAETLMSKGHLYFTVLLLNWSDAILSSGTSFSPTTLACLTVFVHYCFYADFTAYNVFLLCCCIPHLTDNSSELFFQHCISVFTSSYFNCFSSQLCIITDKLITVVLLE